MYYSGRPTASFEQRLSECKVCIIQVVRFRLNSVCHNVKCVLFKLSAFVVFIRVIEKYICIIYPGLSGFV